MQKIPTVFKRDPEDPRRLLPEVHPDCQWVLNGEGIATRKYDGTCVMYGVVADSWFARREVKPGKPPPPDFQPVATDETTGKTVGWVPMESSSFAKWHAEAVANAGGYFVPGDTYELCGPKINGNPEGYDSHRLIRHKDAEDIALSGELDFDRLRHIVIDMSENVGWEGIVWHHVDGRMAKLKGRDFRA